jgi:hypothetical protein
MTERIAHLGAEHDDALRRRLLEVLQALGAVRRHHSSSVAGSQVVEEAEFEVRGQRLLVRAETYAGLAITGADGLIEEILAQLADA